MTIGQILLAVVSWIIAVYRDDIRKLINGQCRSFWAARVQDFAVLKQRSNGPKDDLPNTLHREMVKTTLAMVPCLFFWYVIKPLVDTTQFQMQALYWIVSALAVAALLRFFIIIHCLTVYRGKLAWERLVSTNQ